MSKEVGYWLVCAIVIGYGSIAYGAGNASLGKTKSAACAGCHGAEGNSMAPIFPRLAGQHAKYLNRQLSDFKGQKRTDPSMQAMVAGLSEQDMEDLAAYFAVQKPEFSAREVDQADDTNEDVTVTEELIATGKALFTAGSEKNGVPACSACHGPDANGNGPAGFPKLNGQYLPYLIKSLNDFKDGIRANDDGAMMRTTAGKMTKAQIDAVSAYLANLR